MSALAKFAYDENIDNETDSVGGGFKIFDAAIYDAVIKMAYIQVADSSAVGINCTFDLNGEEYKEVLWVSGRNGTNYYVDRTTGEKKYLGGFLHADALCLLAAKKPLNAVDTEVKLVKLYNKDAGTDVPTKVEVLTDLIGAQIKLGLSKQLVFKQKKVDGKYVNTDETREENAIDKVFRASDSKTTAEVRAKTETAEFYKVWNEKRAGQVIDRTKSKKSKAAGTAGAPGAVAAKPTSNLFDD